MIIGAYDKRLTFFVVVHLHALGTVEGFEQSPDLLLALGVFVQYLVLECFVFLEIVIYVQILIIL